MNPLTSPLLTDLYQLNMIQAYRLINADKAFSTYSRCDSNLEIEVIVGPRLS